jgi:hypothetical protein
MGKIPTGSESIEKMRSGDAIIQYKNFGNGVRGNANFPTPDVAVVEYDAAGVDYETKVADKPKTPQKTEALKVARKKINKNYKTQANYVNRVSDGDLVKLKSSNIIMNKEEGPRENPIFTAENGTNPGDVDFTCKADPAASSYLIFFRLVSETAPNEWAFCKVLGSHKGSKSGFISGLEYEFKMLVVYSTSEGPFFESVILRIL